MAAANYGTPNMATLIWQPQAWQPQAWQPLTYGTPPQHTVVAKPCVCTPSHIRQWQNPRMGHFDDFPSAMLLLFESATFEGWPDVMFAGIDAAGQAMRDA